jgi:hypothetical protein
MRIAKISSMLLLLLCVFVSKLALAATGGALSGIIKDSRGMPMAGALVVLLEGRFSPKVLSTMMTDGEGRFEAKDLFPGWYSLKVSAASYIPIIKTGIKIAAGKMSNLNLMLENLHERSGLGATGDGDVVESKEDIESVLRTASSTRPILRILDSPADGTTQIAADMEAHSDSPSKTSGFRGVVNVYAAAYSVDSDLMNAGSAFTEFALVKDVNPHLTWVIAGVVSDSRFAEIDSLLRFRNVRGHNPSVRFSLGQMPYLSPLAPLTDKNLQTMSVYNIDFQDELKVSEVLSVIYGAESMGSSPDIGARRFRPRWGVGFQPTSKSRFSYLHTTSLPRMSRLLDLPEGENIVLSSPFQHEFGSSMDFRMVGVSHSETSVEQKLGDSSQLRVGLYSDDHSDRRAPLYTTLPYLSRYSTRGVRVAYHRSLGSRLDGTFGYTYGGGVRANSELTQLTPENFHMVVAKLATAISHSGTELSATYRWISGYSLTMIDPYQENFESSSPGVSFMISQVIPYVGRFIPGKLEAQVDVRSLFTREAPDLHNSATLRRLDFVQPPKSVRGGLQLKF